MEHIGILPIGDKHKTHNGKDFAFKSLDINSDYSQNTLFSTLILCIQNLKQPVNIPVKELISQICTDMYNIQIF